MPTPIIFAYGFMLLSVPFMIYMYFMAVRSLVLLHKGKGNEADNFSMFGAFGMLTFISTLVNCWLISVVLGA